MQLCEATLFAAGLLVGPLAMAGGPAGNVTTAYFHSACRERPPGSLMTLSPGGGRLPGGGPTGASGGPGSSHSVGRCIRRR